MSNFGPEINRCQARTRTMRSTTLRDRPDFGQIRPFLAQCQSLMFTDPTGRRRTTKPDATGGVAADVIERLQAVVDRYSKAEVARRSGVPRTTINRYLTGGSAKLDKLLNIANGTGVSLEWLMSGTGKMHPTDNSDWHRDGNEDVTSVEDASAARYRPIKSFPVQANPEHPQVVDHFAFSRDFLSEALHRKPEDLGLVCATGDSMVPTIPDGAILTVDLTTGPTLQNGKLYVFLVGSALVVKRVEIRLDTIVLHSDNTRYLPESIPRSDSEKMTVVGEVLLVSAPPR